MQGYNISEVEAFATRFYGGRKLILTPYAYTITFTGLTQGSTQTSSVSMQANADFLLLGFSHRSNIAAAQNIGNKTAPFIRMLVTDSGSNEQFTQAAVDLENYSSNGGYENPLPYPRVVAGRSTLTFQVSNYAPTAETYAVDITMNGLLVRVPG